MIDKSKLKVGTKVSYQPKHYLEGNRFENGIIKKVPEEIDDPTSVCFNSVRVVYNCGGNWHDYQNYTSALTDTRDLTLGWK